MQSTHPLRRWLLLGRSWRAELKKKPLNFDGIGLGLLAPVMAPSEVMLTKGQEWDWLGAPFWRVQTLLIEFVPCRGGLLYQEPTLVSLTIPVCQHLSDRVCHHRPRSQPSQFTRIPHRHSVGTDRGRGGRDSRSLKWSRPVALTWNTYPIPINGGGEMSIFVTEKAAEEVKRLIGGRPEGEKFYLRKRIVGGGCSGFQH
jgi:hypothetical protein